MDGRLDGLTSINEGRKPIFDGEEIKTLIREYPTNHKYFRNDNIIWFFLEFCALGGGTTILLAGIFSPFSPRTFLYFFVGPIIIGVTIYYLLIHIKLFKRNNGLRFYEDGFLLPTFDYNGYRLEPAFVNYFWVKAIWLISEKDSKITPHVYSINLGEDPRNVWKNIQFITFDLDNKPIPEDIIIVKLFLKIVDNYISVKTGAKTLENGKEAMNFLLKQILRSRGIAFVNAQQTISDSS